MAQVTLRNTKGTPLTYAEVDDNFRFCDSDTNLIINGGFNIWQRGTSFTGPSTGTYTADRFQYNFVSSAVVDILRSTDVPVQSQSGLKTNFSLHVDVTTADTSIAAADNASIRYQIEGYDYSQVEGNTYTLSFWVKSTKIGTYCIALVNSGNDRTFVSEYTINSTNTWEYKTITIIFDYSGGTWDYTNGAGLKINFTLAAGSNFHTTADAWQTGDFRGTSNQVNFLDSTANDFRLSLVKFEPGPEATQFRFRHFERELSYAQRYFEKSYNIASNPGAAISDGMSAGFTSIASTTNPRFLRADFKSDKRASPTMTWYSPSTGTAARVFNSTDSTDVAVSGSSTTSQANTGSPAITAVADQKELRVQWTADSEL